MTEQELDIIYDQVQLPPLLDEFRTALTEEIEAAKKNEANNAFKQWP